MTNTTWRMEGMMCPMCEAHIMGTTRKTAPTAGKKEASFLAEETADREPLKRAIGTAGCSRPGSDPESCEKRELFGQ